MRELYYIDFSLSGQVWLYCLELGKGVEACTSYGGLGIRGTLFAMQVPVGQQHRRRRSFATSQDKDDDLALFHDMHRQEKERKGSTSPPMASETAVQTTPNSSKKPTDKLAHNMAASAMPVIATSADDIFYNDWDKSDYDWLLTPPSTPPVSTLRRHDLHESEFILNGSASTRPTSKTSRLGFSNIEPPSRPDSSSRIVRGDLGLQQETSSGPRVSSTATARRSFSSSSSIMSRPSRMVANLGERVSTVPNFGSSMSRAAQPQSAICRPSTLNTSSRLCMPNTTPNTRPPPTTTPTSRSAGSSRPSTPTRRLATPTYPSNAATTLVRSASVNTGSVKSAVTSRASSPSIKATHAAGFPGRTHDLSLNLRASLHGKASSDCSATCTLSKSGDSSMVNEVQHETIDSTVRSRRLSSSPLAQRGRLLTDTSNGETVSCRKGVVQAGSNAIAWKSVEKERKVLNSSTSSQVKQPTKLTPLKDIKARLSSIRESSIHGRNVSKKSLDGALKHLDLQKSNPKGGFRSFISNFQASSLHSVKSNNDNTKDVMVSSVTNSPMATSSISSSEYSKSVVLDPDGSEFGDDFTNEKGSKFFFPSSQADDPLSLLSNETRVTSWLSSPEVIDDSADIMQIFEQGIESLSGVESPLVSHQASHQGELIECDDFMLGS